MAKRLFLTRFLFTAVAAVAVVVGYAGAERAVVNGPVDPATHVDVDIDLPGSEQLENRPGRDGAGLCVFASMDHAARWHRIKPLIGILERMQRYPGGGWPEKVDQVIAREYPGYKAYVQAEGRANCVPLLKWAMDTGRMACVTYGYGERYGQKIAHMVNLVAWRKGRCCVLDNNFPRTYEWMSEDEFVKRAGLVGEMWVYVFMEPPPPPIPTLR